MDTLSTSKLLQLAQAEPMIGDFSQQFLGWKKISKNDLANLELVGHYAYDPSDHNPKIPASQAQYWGSDAPIILSEYPYSNCGIYRHPVEGSLFFVYQDLSGHAAEHRCRLVQPKLVVEAVSGSLPSE